MSAAPWRRLPRRIECVLSDVARKHDVGVAEVLSGVRYAPVVRARHEVIRRLWGMEFGLNQIGRFLNVNHTSVIYALKIGGVRTEPWNPDEPDLSGEWAI